MVSADLSGMGNASGHPVRWSMMVKCACCLRWMFHNLLLSLLQSYRMDCQEFLSSAEDIAEPLLCHVSKGHN